MAGLFSFSWLKKPNATTPELADQIAAAEAELQRAQTAKEEAQAAFTLDGSEASVKKLPAADEAVAVAAKHIERAKELHKQALERDERERIAKLQAELDEAIVAVTAQRAKAEPFDAKEKALEAELEVVRVQKSEVHAAANRLLPRVQKAHFALTGNTRFPTP